MPVKNAPAAPASRPTPTGSSPARPRRRAVRAAVAVASAGVVLTACTPTIGVQVAQDAAEPICAEVVLATPDVLGGLERTRTNAQATTAWGEPGAAITLRCGVTPPGPTAEYPCQSVPSDAGAVDWLSAAADDGTWTFVTYGRDPAVEVKISPAVKAEHSASFIADLNRAVLHVDATRACVGLGDVTEPTDTATAATDG